MYDFFIFFFYYTIFGMYELLWEYIVGMTISFFFYLVYMFCDNKVKIFV